MTRSILIYGNCQGEELAATGQYLRAFDETVTFKWIPAHKVAAADWMRLYTRAWMSDVVAVWEQTESGTPSAHRSALHERIPRGVEIVKFPPLSALFLWPFSGNDPRIAADPERYPWADSIAASLAGETLDDDALFEKYLEITAARMPDLPRRLRLDATRWKTTDDLADFAMGPWIEENFRTTRLFYTSGHLSAAPVAQMMKELIRRTRCLDPRRAGSALMEVDRLLRYHQGQDFECVPIHPIVAETFGLRWYRPDALYRWHGHEWTFKQYMVHYIRWLPYLD